MDDQDWRKEANTASEIDCFSKWAQKFYKWNIGVRKEIKQKFNRKLRRRNKIELKKGLTED